MICHKIGYNESFARVRIFGDEEFDELPYALLDLLPLLGRVDLFLQYLVENFLRAAVYTPEWHLASGDLLEGDSQREVVRLVAVAFACQHLRCHL